MLSLVGDDTEGERVLAESQRAGIDMALVGRSAEAATATYTAIFNGEGELVIGLADMAIFDQISADEVTSAVSGHTPDSFLFADANLPTTTLQALAAAKGARSLAVVPVSIQKLARLVPILACVDILFLNLHEAGALCGGQACAEDMAQQLAAGPVARGLLSLGPQGALAWANGSVSTIPALESKPINVNGAGDALAGATLARLAVGDEFVVAARHAMAAAALTVESPYTVRTDLTMQALLARSETTRPTETISQ
jgi:pseudouridine kinase